MRKARVLVPPEQLKLFHPRRVVPVWSELPSSAREEVTKHLSRMLQEHREHNYVDGADNDE